MRTIRTTVDEQTYAALVNKRQAAGLPSISALFLNRCDETNDVHEAHSIVRLAHGRASKIPPEKDFRLQDLFAPAEWRLYSKGARLRSGRLFKAAIDAGNQPIRAIGLSPSNHQLYRRSPD